uniref:Uncharacterized protein n=1 Tax=Acrobeloides nanus TaxID=290746 RepID=A0A914CC07_9BILA
MSYSPDVNLPPPLAESESALTTLGSEQFGAGGDDYGLNSNLHQRQHGGNLVGSQYDRRKPYYPAGTADIPPSLTEPTNNRVAMESEQFENDFGPNNVRNRNKDPNVPSAVKDLS